MSRLGEVIRKAFEAAMVDVRIALPVRVEAHDVAAQTVDVAPLIQNRWVDDEGAVTLEDPPVITAVPICWPRGGGFFVTMPIEKGDTGQIVVCDRSIDQWHKKGGLTNPLDLRTHELSGAVFHPGLSDSQNPIEDAHSANMVLGLDGDVQIHIKPGSEIHIGSENASDWVAKAGLTKNEINSLRNTVNNLVTAYNAHVHPGVTVGPGSTGPIATPASPPAAVGDVKADKVKVD